MANSTVNGLNQFTQKIGSWNIIGYIVCCALCAMCTLIMGVLQVIKIKNHGKNWVHVKADLKGPKTICKADESQMCVDEPLDKGQSCRRLKCSPVIVSYKLPGDNTVYKYTFNDKSDQVKIFDMHASDSKKVDILVKKKEENGEHEVILFNQFSESSWSYVLLFSLSVIAIICTILMYRNRDSTTFKRLAGVNAMAEVIRL